MCVPHGGVAFSRRRRRRRSARQVDIIIIIIIVIHRHEGGRGPAPSVLERFISRGLGGVPPSSTSHERSNITIHTLCLLALSYHYYTPFVFRVDGLHKKTIYRARDRGKISPSRAGAFKRVRDVDVRRATCDVDDDDDDDGLIDGWIDGLRDDRRRRTTTTDDDERRHRHRGFHRIASHA